MATILKTSGDFLADIQNGLPADTRARGFDSGSPPTAGSQPTTATAETPTPSPSTGGVASLGTYQAPAPSTPVIGPYGRYLNPILGGAEDVGKQTQAASQSFQSLAGPRRTYEGIGGQGILEAGITQPSQLEGARALANASYTGPQALDEATLSKVRESARKLSEVSGGLGSYTGLQELVNQGTPGLTPGELAYEAKHLRASPEFQGQARAAGIEAKRATGGVDVAAQAAQDYAAARTADEAAIKAASQGYLGGRLTDLNTLLDQLVSQKGGEQASVVQAFDKLNTTGDLSTLRGQPGVDFDVEKILQATPEVAQLQKAQAARQAIMDKYQDIADVPLLGLRVNSKGREIQDFPKAWFDENRGNYTQEQYQALQDRARARQAELEGLFTGPTGKRSKSDTGVRGTGEFATLSPLYAGEEFRPTNVQQFLKFDPGMKPSQGNVSTEAQRSQINAIHDLLGHVERLQAEDPYRAATIGMNTLDYLKSEEEAWKNQSKSVQKATQGWVQDVRHARMKYERAQKKGTWSKILGGVATVGLDRLFGPIMPPPVTQKKSENQLTGGFANAMAGI